jgi:hypothetical protein
MMQQPQKSIFVLFIRIRNLNIPVELELLWLKHYGKPPSTKNNEDNKGTNALL